MRKSNPISNHDHLSQAQLLHYATGKMSDAEMHQVERHLLDCDLCSDALEGIAILDPVEAISTMDELKGRLQARLGAEKSSAKSFYGRMSIAASLVILLTAAFYFVVRNVELHHLAAKQEPDEGNASVLMEKVTESVALGEELMMSKPEEPQEVLTILPEAVLENLEIREQQGLALNESLTRVVVHPKSTKISERPDSFVAIVSNKDASPAARTMAMDIKSDIDEDIAVAKKEIKLKPVILPESDYKSSDKIVAGGITGLVKDSEGQPLPGVNVLIKGTNKGRVTDLDGRFFIDTVAESTELVFNLVGYTTKELTASANGAPVEVTLQEDVKALSEVVVIGYGTRKSALAENTVITSPEPLVGMKQYNNYLKANARYTAEALDRKVKGNVKLEFYVEPDGTLNDIKVVGSIGYGLDEEAIRLVKEGPYWKPGTSNNQPVRQKVTLKVPFNYK